MRRKLLGDPEPTEAELAAEKAARKEAARKALEADSKRADVAQAALRAMYV